MTGLLDKRCLALLTIIAAVITTLMTIQLTLAAHAHDARPQPDGSGSANAATSELSTRA